MLCVPFDPSLPSKHPALSFERRIERKGETLPFIPPGTSSAHWGKATAGKKGGLGSLIYWFPAVAGDCGSLQQPLAPGRLRWSPGKEQPQVAPGGCQLRPRHPRTGSRAGTADARLRSCGTPCKRPCKGLWRPEIWGIEATSRVRRHESTARPDRRAAALPEG